MTRYRNKPTNYEGQPLSHGQLAWRKRPDGFLIPVGVGFRSGRSTQPWPLGYHYIPDSESKRLEDFYHELEHVTDLIQDTKHAIPETGQSKFEYLQVIFNAGRAEYFHYHFHDHASCSHWVGDPNGPTGYEWLDSEEFAKIFPIQCYGSKLAINYPDLYTTITHLTLFRTNINGILYHVMIWNLGGNEISLQGDSGIKHKKSNHLPFPFITSPEIFEVAKSIWQAGKHWRPGEYSLWENPANSCARYYDPKGGNRVAIEIRIPLSNDDDLPDQDDYRTIIQSFTPQAIDILLIISYCISSRMKRDYHKSSQPNKYILRLNVGDYLNITQYSRSSKDRSNWIKRINRQLQYLSYLHVYRQGAYNSENISTQRMTYCPKEYLIRILREDLDIQEQDKYLGWEIELGDWVRNIASDNSFATLSEFPSGNTPMDTSQEPNTPIGIWDIPWNAKALLQRRQRKVWLWVCLRSFSLAKTSKKSQILYTTIRNLLEDIGELQHPITEEWLESVSTAVEDALFDGAEIGLLQIVKYTMVGNIGGKDWLNQQIYLKYLPTIQPIGGFQSHRVAATNDPQDRSHPGSSERLRIYRQEKEVTQKELAYKAQIPQPRLSRIENGIIPVTCNDIEYLSDLVNEIVKEKEITSMEIEGYYPPKHIELYKLLKSTKK